MATACSPQRTPASKLRSRPCARILPIAALTVPAVVDHLEGIISELENPPIIMGHSMGGLLTQILLDHGFGAAGVAIDSVPPQGVRRVPLAQIRAGFPVLSNPLTVTGQ